VLLLGQIDQRSELMGRGILWDKSGSTSFEEVKNLGFPQLAAFAQSHVE